MGRPATNLSGQKFGKLTAIEIVERGGAHHSVKWLCQCECGKTKVVESQLLKRGIITDCGCKVKNRLVGKRFGRLVVLAATEIKPRKSSGIIWECLCDCGNITFVETGNLIAKTHFTASCGCMKKERNTKHGLSNARIYKTYQAMLDRCSNPNCKAYKHYGERGIKVCPSWTGEFGFEAFYKWAVKNGYQDHLTIDRIDVNGNYSPKNCRWATMKQQANNTRQNRRIIVDGVTHTLTEWSEINSICVGTIRSRLKRGWPEDRAVTEPIKKRA